MNFSSSFFRIVLALLFGTCAGLAQSITGFSPKFGSVGESIRINGSGFTGTTNVIFHNGKSASFAATSDSQINAIVPAGAETGPITVKKGVGQATTFEDFTVIGKEPYVTSFSPISGAAGTPITLHGVHFTGVTNAKINGINAQITQLTSDIQIRIAAPADVTTGPISLTRSNLTFVTSSNYFAPAAITNFAPSRAIPGTTIVIKGKNFIGTTALRFNNVPAPEFTVDSNTQITATLPQNATTGLININPPGGQANSTSNFVVLPYISGFSPQSGKPGTNVTITGLNLLGNTVVRFNGTASGSLPTLTATQIVAVVPAGATSGHITVTTTNGVATNASPFYLPPSISGFTPNAGSVGNGVTLTGNNFTNATDVSFNGVSASFGVVNNTTITSSVPADAMSGPISVTAPGGNAISGQNFFIKPGVNAFSPGFGVAGTVVTINGTSFTNVSAVRFNGTDTAFTPVNNTQITATVPVGATTGPISVVAPGGTGVSAENFIVGLLTLSINLLTNDVVKISWTTNATGYSLQANTNFNSPTNWVTLTNVPIVSGGMNAVTNSATNTATFFRLHK